MELSWFWIRRTLSRLWVRTAAFCLLAVLGAILAAPLPEYTPLAELADVTGDALETVLEALSSSMLVIATFSLGTMASAFASASQSTTPRAVPLLLEDSRAQNAVGTFIGAFLFSVLARIALYAGLYDDTAKVVLFFLALLVVAAVVLTLIRWTEEITRMGRIDTTLDRLRDVTVSAMVAPMGCAPYGGVPLEGPVPDGRGVEAEHPGFVANIDEGLLVRAVGERGLELFLLVKAGDAVFPGQELARVIASVVEDEVLDDVRRAISIAERRTLSEDPLLGFIAISEVASRALSPGINDPGTARDAIACLVQALHRSVRVGGPNAGRPWLHVPAVEVADVLEQALMPIVRDGATILEVQLAVQDALVALVRSEPSWAPQLRSVAGRAVEHAAARLPVDGQADALRARFEAGWAVRAAEAAPTP